MDMILEPEDLTTSTAGGGPIKIIDVIEKRHEVIGADGMIQIYVGHRIAVPLMQRPMPLGKGWMTIACPKLQLKGYYREAQTKA